MITKILGILIGIIALIWLGNALYDAWPPLLPIYLALLLHRAGIVLANWNDD